MSTKPTRTTTTWTARELAGMEPVRPWRMPPRRVYVPKPAGPGQRITWTRTVGYAATETRTGEVWSAGPLPGSVWVQPDGAPAGDTVLVMLRSMTEHPAYPTGWQHDTIRRVEHLRQSKGLFAEVRWLNRSYYPCEPGAPGAREDVVAWHCDRDCPGIGHQTRDRRGWEPDVPSTITMLLSATARGRSDLCRRCVYLTEPGAAGAAA